MRKDGQWGVTKPLRVDYETLPGIDSAEDRAAVGLLLGNQLQEAPQDNFDYYDRYSDYNATRPTRVKLSPHLYGTILPTLCDTGRFVWLLSSEQGLDDGQQLAWDDGPAWGFRLRFESFDRQRKWRLRGELTRGKQVRPLSDVMHCYTSGLLLLDNKLARFDAPHDFRWIDMLRETDVVVIPAADREKLLEELWRLGQPPLITGAPTLELPSEVGQPTGRLVVHTPEQPKRYMPQPYNLNATLAFRYEEYEASYGGTSSTWLSPEGDRVVQRDPSAEAALAGRLGELGLDPKPVYNRGETPEGHFQFPRKLLNQVVETLVDEGWEVEAEGSLVRKGGGMTTSINSGVDWFDLEGQVDFDGVEAPLPDLLAALRQGERYVKLGDGSRGLLPEAWLEQFAPLADLAPKREGDALRFQPGQALLLDSLLAARGESVSLQVDRQFAALRKRLRSFSGVKPAAAPRVFKGELRDYQKEGLGWMRFLEKFGFGGCLADDMGLGKTIQVLAALADRNRRQPKGAEARPSLVVAPKSVVPNWLSEAEKFAPRLAVADYTGIDRKERIEDFNEYDVVLTTYGTMRQDIKRIGKTPWDYAILDEAQAIKNAASQSAKASRLINARHRLALSGTPVENHLGELWSIFEFLNPGMLGKSKSLRALSRGASEGDDARIESLRKGLAPFLLRRTKQQVLPQLPEKNEQRLTCELPPAQRKHYNELRDHYRSALTQRIAKSGIAKSKIHVLEALLRLRQAACHPGLIDKRMKSKPSAKLSLLVEQLTEILDEGHKALVFSQFTTMLDIVKSRLDKVGIPYEYLDGQTSNRQERIERFQTDEACPVFLISLKAGGTGLNLTAADFVFLLDPWWNPAVEAQAIDRAHRIGQTKPVFAYRLIAQDTVEEKILELQAKKSDLAQAVISGDGSLLKSLSADDLQSLLS